MKLLYLVKTENDVQSFVSEGEWSLCISLSPKSVSLKEYEFMKDYHLFQTSPRTMIDVNGVESYSLPAEIHRISGISYEKPEAEFLLELIEVDFQTKEINILEAYYYKVKQWPRGYIKIEKVM